MTKLDPIIAGAALLLLCACAAPPAPPPDESPFALVKRRFYAEAQTPVLDGIEDAVKGYARFIDKIQGRKTQEVPDQRRPAIDESFSVVFWTAYYTDVNFGQLAMPSAVLRQRCIGKGGQWRVVELATADPLAGQRVDPVAAYMDAFSRVTRHLEAQRAYVGFEELRSAVARDVARQTAADAAISNQRIAQLFSAEGYRMAQRLESFGVFECQESGGTWRAAVLPMLMRARDASNQLDSSSVRIGIQLLPTEAK